MNTFIQTKLINIGNSKGIVIPKKMLSILSDTVSLKQVNNSIVIERYNNNVIPQEEWEQQLLAMKDDYDDNEFNDFDITLKDGLDD